MRPRDVRSSGRARAAESLPQPQLAWAYFCDIDGTLVDIAAVPDRVRIGSEMRGIIDRLYEATGGAVALVSGRSVVDIDRLYPHGRMPLSGQHGVEWRDANGVHVSLTQDARLLDRARATLSRAIAHHDGLVLEDKGCSLALHYRQAPQLAAYAHRLMRAMQLEAGCDFAVQRGKRVVELKPAAANKGEAVTQLMMLPSFAGRTPVFVGDDVTDEDGFAAVNELGGHSVKVGTGKTVAKWRLPDISELMTWLSRAL